MGVGASSTTSGSPDDDFKQSLLSDVFTSSSKNVLDMEKVTMIIWKFRDTPEMVRFVSEFLAKVSKGGLYGESSAAA